MADPAMLAREWVEFALSDCEMAVRAIEMPPKLCQQAMFHSQQSVEKILKAFLMYRGQVFEKTHDLGRLCRSVEPRFPIEWPDVDWLTEYAVDFRYPGVEQPSEQEAERGIEVARTVYDQVLALLPSACRPSTREKSNGGDGP